MLRSVSDPHRSFLIGFSLLCPAGVRLKLRKHAGLRPIRDNVVCDFIQLGPQEIPSASDDARRLISRTLRPAFDAVWRAAGLVADPYYDAEGTLPFDLVTS
jgi:hypothetical protein